jgi:DNA replication protein DnaC
MTFYNTLNAKNKENYNLTLKVSKDPQESYFVHGKAGTGKTVFVVQLVKKLLLELQPEYETNILEFVRMVDLIRDAQRSAMNGDEGWQYRQKMKMYKEVEYLVIDDIGVEKNTDFVDSVVYDIIDTRYGDKKITYFTSNYSLEELGNKYHSRIASRITEMCNFGANVLELTGLDLRTTKTS